MRRRAMPAGRVLGVGLICFAAWVLLDARDLERSAAAGALGPRRSVVLAVLRPIDRVTAFFGLDRVSIALDKALGRNTRGPIAGGGQQAASPIGSRRSSPTTAPVAAPGARPGPSVTTTSTVPARLTTPLRQPTAAAPLRVLIVGDSIAKDFGESMLEQLGRTGVVNPTLDAKPATGLSRPDYFDWNAQLASDLDRVQPELMVAMFGGNDAQSFLVAGHPVQFGTPEWTAAYSARVTQFIGQATARGCHVLWIGMPAMSSASFGASMQILNGIDKAAVAAVAGPGGGFFDSWPLFVDSSGHYAAYLPNSDGKVALMRQSDGIHLSRAGADRLAAAVIIDLQHRFAISLQRPPA